MANTGPKRPTAARLGVLVMPNGEILCDGRTVGWLNQLGRYITYPRDYEKHEASK